MSLRCRLGLVAALIPLGVPGCGGGGVIGGGGVMSTGLPPAIGAVQLIADYPTLDPDTQGTEYTDKEVRLLGAGFSGRSTDFKDPSSVEHDLEVQVRWLWLHPDNMRAVSTEWRVVPILRASNTQVDVRLPRLSHAGRLEFQIYARGRGWSAPAIVDIRDELKAPEEPLIVRAIIGHTGTNADPHILMFVHSDLDLTGPNLIPADATPVNATDLAVVQWRQVLPTVTSWSQAGILAAGWNVGRLNVTMDAGLGNSMVPGIVEFRVLHTRTSVHSNVVAAQVIN